MRVSSQPPDQPVFGRCGPRHRSFQATVAVAAEVVVDRQLAGADLDADAADAGEGVNVEVGAGDITIYDNVDRKSGDSIWCDLCRGPHLPNTKLSPTPSP